MTGRGAYPQNPTIECISGKPRRDLLQALTTWGPRLTEQQLARYLAATNQETPTIGAIDTELDHADLIHRHLPMLEAADLVTWADDEATVEITSHPALEDPRFERLLDLQTEDLDAVLSALAHEYRRVALTVLEADAATTRPELARAIQQHAPDAPDAERPTVGEISLSLKHAHLPTLDASGFVEFDPTSSQISYKGHPGLEAVFTIIYGRDESVAAKLNGFLDDLAESYRSAREELNTPLGWPHEWRRPHHG